LMARVVILPAKPSASLVKLPMVVIEFSFVITGPPDATSDAQPSRAAGMARINRRLAAILERSAREE